MPSATAAASGSACSSPSGLTPPACEQHLEHARPGVDLIDPRAGYGTRHLHEHGGPRRGARRRHRPPSRPRSGRRPVRRTRIPAAAMVVAEPTMKAGSPSPPEALPEACSVHATHREHQQARGGVGKKTTKGRPTMPRGYAVAAARGHRTFVACWRLGPAVRRRKRRPRRSGAALRSTDGRRR